MTEAETERAAVVALLRREVRAWHPSRTYVLALMIDAIERGEHLTNEGK